MFDSKEALASYFLRSPGLRNVELYNWPGLTTLPALPGTLTDLLIENCHV